jgi:pyrimidine and pyridine-specific 5'-nucleotidase
MHVYIHRYFVNHLALDDESATLLHQRYYREYGLAIEGLVRFNHIDAMAYNSEVDDALPLEDILKPDPELRRLLLAIDRTKVKKLWLFTNAYLNHGLRVIKLLGIDDLFDGITYCDYSKVPMICKPKKAMFQKAMQEAGETDVSKCYFIDDSYINVAGAKKFGWKATVHYVDPEEELPEKPAGHYVVRDLNELPTLFTDLFDHSKLTGVGQSVDQPVEKRTDLSVY